MQSRPAAIVIGERRTVIAAVRPPTGKGERPRPLTRTLDYVPPGIMSAPEWFLDRAADVLHGEGTVIVRHVPLNDWGADNRPYRDQIAEFAARAATGGWWASDNAIDRASGWLTLSKKDAGVVHLGVLDGIDQTKTPLFRLDWHPQQIADQLATFQGAVGVPYRASPGTAGCAAIRLWHETKPLDKSGEREIPTWIWREPPDGVMTSGDVMWARKIDTDTRKLRWVHAYDTNRQYLAAMAAVALSWSNPQPDIPDWDMSRAGLWRVKPAGARPRPGPLPPLLDWSIATKANVTWATTALVAQARKAGIKLEIIDAYLSRQVRKQRRDGTEVPGTGRVLRGPAEMFRDAQRACPAVPDHPEDCWCEPCALAATLKQVVNHAVGMMGNPASQVRRIDWHYAIRDMARMLLLIKVYDAAKKHGLFPIKVERDCIWYASDDPDPAALGAKLGVVTDGQIGRLKIERKKCLTMAEYLDEQAVNSARRVAQRRA